MCENALSIEKNQYMGYKKELTWKCQYYKYWYEFLFSSTWVSGVTVGAAIFSVSCHPRTSVIAIIIIIIINPWNKNPFLVSPVLASHTFLWLPVLWWQVNELKQGTACANKQTKQKQEARLFCLLYFLSLHFQLSLSVCICLPIQCSKLVSVCVSESPF